MFEQRSLLILSLGGIYNIMICMVHALLGWSLCNETSTNTALCVCDLLDKLHNFRPVLPVMVTLQALLNEPGLLILHVHVHVHVYTCMHVLAHDRCRLASV